MPVDVATRLLGKVQPVPDMGCWLWTGALRNGYAVATIARRVEYVHRAMYALAYGTLPAGSEIDHLCKVRRCVFPGHLEPVTKSTNMRRANGTDTHCRRGHARAVYGAVDRRGAITCRACHALSERRRRGGVPSR